MRGVVFQGERQLELMNFPDPTPGEGEVVVEMKASGMCGSDLHQYRRPKGGAAIGGLAAATEPVIAGHEPCGVVAAIGPGVGKAQAFSDGAGHGRDYLARRGRETRGGRGKPLPYGTEEAGAPRD